MATTLSRPTGDTFEVPQRAAVGAVVTLHDLQDDAEWTITIVETEDADPDEDRISDECPLGAAILAGTVGDTVTIEAPSGVLRYRILSISSPSA